MTTALPPGATIGILGGGQLGRMTALAAAPLGYHCHVYAPEPESPAAEVCRATTTAAYEDTDALDRFAAQIDVVTYEFENVPRATAGRLAGMVPVRPGPRALEVAQHRLSEKRFAEANGVAVAPFMAVSSVAELVDALGRIGRPAVLKTCRFGYDGKGQTRIDAATDPSAAYAAIGGGEAILEAFVPFEREVSVIVARGLDGSVVPYPVVENRHVDHILDTTIAPAAITPEVAAAATGAAVRLTEALEVVGLLAVELFVTADGAVLMNEIAPRPHNSGHWTMDGCVTSQFEQLVRAVTGLPLGSVAVTSPVIMKNLIGDAVHDWPAIAAEPFAKLHLYGKAESRPGRKMGHVNRLRRFPGG